jgi:predicted DNA binding CopG/RHH family protein
MKKDWPALRSDEEAERFVAEADLTEYDFSTMVPVSFELRRKDRSLSLRLPEALLEVVKAGRGAAGHPVPALHAAGERWRKPRRGADGRPAAEQGGAEAPVERFILAGDAAEGAVEVGQGAPGRSEGAASLARSRWART